MYLDLDGKSCHDPVVLLVTRNPHDRLENADDGIAVPTAGHLVWQLLLPYLGEVLLHVRGVRTLVTPDIDMDSLCGPVWVCDVHADVGIPLVV